MFEEMKEDINVLEIEPAAVTDANKLSSTTVSKWLGKESRESQREDISKLTSSSMDKSRPVISQSIQISRESFAVYVSPSCASTILPRFLCVCACRLARFS